MDEPNWTVTWSEVIDGRVTSSAENAFNSIHIRFVDRATGEERVARSVSTDAISHLGLLERSIRVGAPMDAQDAQALADRAVAVGTVRRHGFLVFRTDQMLRTGNDRRPASSMRAGDTLRLEEGGGLLSVIEVSALQTPEADQLKILVGDLGYEERLQIEAAIARLEQRVSS